MTPLSTLLAHEEQEAALEEMPCSSVRSMDIIQHLNPNSPSGMTSLTFHPSVISFATLGPPQYTSYQSTLKLLFNSVGKDSNTQLADLTMQIMQALQTNLDGKSKQYKDPALTELFLMNNIYYMVRFVETSEAKDLLGDDWVQRHLRIVQQHAFQYKRVAWAKILQCFSLPNLNFSSGVLTAMVKERLKSFNMQFEELHLLQCQWMVPDDGLRKQLRLSIAEVILSAYGTFTGRYGHYIEFGKSPQKYMRYTLKEVEAMLDKLFEGNVTQRESCLKGRCLMIGTGSLHPALRVICPQE